MSSLCHPVMSVKMSIRSQDVGAAMNHFNGTGSGRVGSGVDGVAVRGVVVVGSEEYDAMGGSTRQTTFLLSIEIMVVLFGLPSSIASSCCTGTVLPIFYYPRRGLFPRALAMELPRHERSDWIAS